MARALHLSLSLSRSLRFFLRAFYLRSVHGAEAGASHARHAGQQVMSIGLFQRTVRERRREEELPVARNCNTGAPSSRARAQQLAARGHHHHFFRIHHQADRSDHRERGNLLRAAHRSVKLVKSFSERSANRSPRAQRNEGQFFHGNFHAS